MSQRGNKITAVSVAVFFLAVWAVFQFGFPYHLAMKERIVMFLCDRTFLSSYFWKPGGISILIGDYITQFYAIPCVAAIATTLLLFFFWAGLRAAFNTLKIPYPTLTALVPTAVEAALCINVTYPVAMITGGILAILIFNACSSIIGKGLRNVARVAVSAALLVISTLALINNDCNINLKTKSFDSKEELDYKIYFLASRGEWDKVENIGLKNPYQSKFVSYYYNVALSRGNRLPDGLLDAYQPLYHGLFIPVKPGTTFYEQMASIDALAAAGDYSQAQHSAMLAATFSPRQRSSKMLQELSDLAFANGDYDAARRYLKMLEKTSTYRNWAKDGLQLLKEYNGLLTIKNDYEDILFSHNDYRRSLSLIARSEINGKAATDYLLCLDLLNKNLVDFRSDYDMYYHDRYDLVTVPTIYQEALLMTFDDSLNPDAQLMEYHIESITMERCTRFLSGYENQLRRSYWFYHKYAQPA